MESFLELRSGKKYLRFEDKVVQPKRLRNGSLGTPFLRIAPDRCQMFGHRADDELLQGFVVTEVHAQQTSRTDTVFDVHIENVFLSVKRDEGRRPLDSCDFLKK